MVGDDLSFLRNSDEKLMYKGILDKAKKSSDTFSFNVTDFLDPFMQRMAVSIANSFQDIDMSLIGGFSNAERQLAVFYPDFNDKPDIFDYITILKFDKKNASLSHRDVLGALISLGIERRVIGDIRIGEDILFVVKKEIAPFVLSELKKVKNIKIDLEVCDETDITESKPNFKEDTLIIPSLRLDAFLSKAFNISRKDSVKLLNSGKIKLNHREEQKLHAELNEDDIISVRGFGRIIFKGVLGSTNKGNLRVKINRYVEEK